MYHSVNSVYIGWVGHGAADEEQFTIVTKRKDHTGNNFGPWELSLSPSYAIGSDQMGSAAALFLCGLDAEVGVCRC